MQLRNQSDLAKYLHQPGQLIQIQQQIEDQIRQHLDKDLGFFGGHPKSLEKSQMDRIFSLSQKDGILHPCDYIVCEKTDGVRYLLLITKYGQSYFISRNTSNAKSKKALFYKVNMRISPNYNHLTSNNRIFRNIIQILDGQLVIDEYSDHQNLKFLVFDALVHFGKDIRLEGIRQRLNAADLFIKNNNFSFFWRKTSTAAEQIPVIQLYLKDFFSLDGNKPYILDFLFNNYIPCLHHQNDGVIFNRLTGAYKSGRNDCYLKWKPPHLNTIDFLIIPNTIIEDYPDQILDLYLHQHDTSTNQYRPVFYSFMVVSQQKYRQVSEVLQKKKDQNDQIVQGIVAECNLISSKQYKDIYRDLYKSTRTVQQIKQMVMMASENQSQLTAIKRLQNSTLEHSWNIIRFRQDKKSANNSMTARNIQATIKQNITKQKLIERSNLYFDKRKQFDSRHGMKRPA